MPPDVAREAGETLARAEQALEAAPAKDREEMINLMDDLRDALREGAAERAGELRRELDEILFYLLYGTSSQSRCFLAPWRSSMPRSSSAHSGLSSLGGPGGTGAGSARDKGPHLVLVPSNRASPDSNRLGKVAGRHHREMLERESPVISLTSRTVSNCMRTPPSPCSCVYRFTGSGSQRRKQVRPPCSA